MTDGIAVPVGWHPMILAAIEDIHLNPVRRKLCVREIDWKWSSARDHLLPGAPQDPDLPRLSPLPPDLLE